MTEYAEKIREAFESHEHLAPDAAAVFARAQLLARTYRRRRAGAQAAGGAVLGASLVAGGIKLPHVSPRGSRPAVIVQPAASSSATASGGSPSPEPAPSAPSASASASAFNRDLDAYFAAGYDLQAAQKLAALWNMSAQPGDLSAVKAEAGRRLLAGETLPVKPNAAAVKNAKQEQATAAFFEAGYDYEDAQRLSTLWKVADTYEAKVMAGEKLLAGEALPVEADPTPVEDANETRAISAFVGAGYDYDDAKQLATLWNTGDPSAAKVMAGEKLLAGETLPIAPDPASATDAMKSRAVGAFFNAGYDFADAQRLAALWKTADEYVAKVMAGEKLLAGEKLPFAP